MSDDAAYDVFCKMRWPATHGAPVCPRCSKENPYRIKNRKFKCRTSGCHYQFTVTSGTLFASHKLSFSTLLKAYELAKATKSGIGSTTLAREIGITGKAAYVLAAKIREALVAGQDPMQCGVSERFNGYWQR